MNVINYKKNIEWDLLGVTKTKDLLWFIYLIDGQLVYETEDLIPGCEEIQYDEAKKLCFKYNGRLKTR